MQRSEEELWITSKLSSQLGSLAYDAAAKLGTTAIPKLAIVYPENGRMYFVKHLEKTNQGSMTLVRDGEGKLFLRKKSALGDNNQARGDPLATVEFRNFRGYEFTPKLVSGFFIPDSLPGGETSLITISEYANGGNLKAFAEGFWNHCGSVPEVLIWQLLDQILTDLGLMHRDKDVAIAHRDIDPSHVYLTWSGSRLPRFHLLDFGKSLKLELKHSHAKQNQAEFKIVPKSIATDLMQLSDVVSFLAQAETNYVPLAGSPAPSKSTDDEESEVEDEDEETEEEEANASEEASAKSKSSPSPSGHIGWSPGSGTWKHFSKELHAIYTELRALSQLIKFTNRDELAQKYDADDIRLTVAAQLAAHTTRLNWGEEPHWVEKGLNTCDPALFNSMKELLLSELPAGPWKLVQIDPVTYQPINSTEESYGHYIR